MESIQPDFQIANSFLSETGQLDLKGRMLKIVKMMENRIFRMPDLKSPKMVKMMDLGIFRMPVLKSTKMVKMKENRIFRQSQQPSGPGYPRKHQKRMEMNQQGTSRTTFGC